jgi:hypothetical protein
LPSSCSLFSCFKADEGSERIRFRPGNISASSQSVLHPEDNSSFRSTGLHSANSVLGGMDHEGTTSSKLKT